MFIHPRCVNILKGLETVRLKKGADYVEEDSFVQHVTAAAGYLVETEFSVTRFGGGMVTVGGT